MMKLELQQELLRCYPKFLRKPGKRLLAGSAVTSVDSASGQRFYSESRGGRRRADGFREYLADDTAPFDSRGVECDDGWFTVIDHLCRACETEIDHLVAEGVPKECWPRIAQIKEKFGGMRFYVKGAISDALRARILDAENIECCSICEHCGETRDPREGTTYCSQCEERFAASTDRPSLSWEDYDRYRVALRALLDSRPG